MKIIDFYIFSLFYIGYVFAVEVENLARKGVQIAKESHLAWWQPQKTAPVCTRMDLNLFEDHWSDRVRNHARARLAEHCPTTTAERIGATLNRKSKREPITGVVIVISIIGIAAFGYLYHRLNTVEEAAERAATAYLELEKTAVKMNNDTIDEMEIKNFDHFASSLFAQNALPDMKRIDAEVMAAFHLEKTIFSVGDLVVRPISCSEAKIHVEVCLHLDENGQSGSAFSVAHQGKFTNNGTLFRFRVMPSFLFEPSSGPAFFADKCEFMRSRFVCTGVSELCKVDEIDTCKRDLMIVGPNFVRAVGLGKSYLIATNEKNFRKEFGPHNEMLVTMPASGIVRLEDPYSTKYHFGERVLNGRSVQSLHVDIDEIDMEDFNADHHEELEAVHKEMDDVLEKVRNDYPKDGFIMSALRSVWNWITDCIANALMAVGAIALFVLAVFFLLKCWWGKKC